MPVTFSVAAYHGIQYEKDDLPGEPTVSSSTYSHQQAMANEKIRSTPSPDHTFLLSVPFPRNALVKNILEAYINHQTLVIGPDDVWECIFTQLNGYLNTKEHTVDANLHDWRRTVFSTTPSSDVVSSIVPHLESHASMAPPRLSRVTLLGTQQDWISIFQRVETLGRFGAETVAWCGLLKPVLARFVMSFEPGYANSVENWTFWQYIVEYRVGGSRPGWLTGWITAFCAFDKHGHWAETEEVSLRYQYLLAQKGDAPTLITDQLHPVVEQAKSRGAPSWVVPESFFTGGVSSQSTHPLPQGLEYTLGKVRVTPASMDGQTPPILIIDGFRYLKIDLIRAIQ